MLESQWETESCLCVPIRSFCPMGEPTGTDFGIIGFLDFVHHLVF
jgi:hypothetical protein